MCHDRHDSKDVFPPLVVVPYFPATALFSLFTPSSFPLPGRVLRLEAPLFAFSLFRIELAAQEVPLKCSSLTYVHEMRTTDIYNTFPKCRAWLISTLVSMENTEQVRSGHVIICSRRGISCQPLQPPSAVCHLSRATAGPYTENRTVQACLTVPAAFWT